jgi:chromosome segregation ATPase
VEIVMTMKIEESEDKVNEVVKQRMKDLHNKGQYDLSQSPEEYEKIIQKLEAEVRNHISVQQQMKLYIESYQSKVEELEPLEENAQRFKEEIKRLKKTNEEYMVKIEKTEKEMEEKQKMYKKKIVEQERMYDVKLENLEIKIRDLQNKIGKILLIEILLSAKFNML